MRKRFYYSPKLIAFIQRHWNIDVNGNRLAELIGVPYTNLKAAVKRLRTQGYHFESNASPIGRVVHHPRQDGSGVITRIKTENGWEYVPNGKPRFGNPVSQPRPARKKRGPKPKATPPQKIQPASSDKAKSVVRGSLGKAHILHADRNPEIVKVKSDKEKIEAGWVWVQTDKRTRVLRAPEKIKTA